jgi:hypothetical protein
VVQIKPFQEELWYREHEGPYHGKSVVFSGSDKVFLRFQTFHLVNNLSSDLDDGDKDDPQNIGKLTRVIAREDFMNFGRRESFRSHTELRTLVYVFKFWPKICRKTNCRDARTI